MPSFGVPFQAKTKEAASQAAFHWANRSEGRCFSARCFSGGSGAFELGFLWNVHQRQVDAIRVLCWYHLKLLDLSHVSQSLDGLMGRRDKGWQCMVLTLPYTDDMFGRQVFSPSVAWGHYPPCVIVFLFKQLLCLLSSNVGCCFNCPWNVASSGDSFSADPSR